MNDAIALVAAITISAVAIIGAGAAGLVLVKQSTDTKLEVIRKDVNSNLAKVTTHFRIALTCVICLLLIAIAYFVRESNDVHT